MEIGFRVHCQIYKLYAFNELLLKLMKNNNNLIILSIEPSGLNWIVVTLYQSGLNSIWYIIYKRVLFEGVIIQK